jgi:uncharacterized protein YgiB involved in biofilm formation
MVMKKSSSIRLVLLGSASIALAACGDDGPPKDARFFSNLQECSAVYDTSQCLDAERQAEQSYAQEAPKFSGKEQCEAEFGVGNCENRQAAADGQQASSGGGSFFMPMLMGYMMGNMLGGNRYAAPVYRGPDNTAITQNRGKMFNIGNFGGAGRSAASTFRPATQVAQVQRGGFGSSANAFRSSAGS